MAPFLTVNLLDTTLQLINVILNIYLISEFGDLLRDLHSAFTDPRVKIHLIGGPNSLLNKQENFLEIQNLPNMTFIQSLLLEENLINSIDGLVLIGSDPEMREIAQAEVDLEIKLKLLPIKNPEAFMILDSKVGLQELIDKLKISAPPGLIIENYADLSHIESRINLPYFFKGDNGGGGAHVRRVNAYSSIPNSSELTYPLLLQEEVIGSEISVDAFFNNGNLAAYIYSDQIKSMSKYGPSFERRISRPPIEDFLVPLEALGRSTQAHGLVNTTFIMDSKTNKHFLIEFDPRANAWHFLAPLLGIDLISIFGGLASERIATPKQFDFRVINLDRFIFRLSGRRNPLTIAKEIATLFDPNLLVISGRKLNGLEIFKIMIFRLPKILAFKIMKKLFRLLPDKITEPLKRRRLTNRVARRVLGAI